MFFLQGAKESKRKAQRSSRDPVLTRDQSSTTLVGHLRDKAEEDPVAVCVEPEQGAVFRRQSGRTVRTQATHRDPVVYEEVRQSRNMAQQTHQDGVTDNLLAGAVYDFRDQHTLPRPVLSQPTSPSIVDTPFMSPRDEQEQPTYPKATSSQPGSRRSSVAGSLSRLAGRPRQPIVPNDDAWLSSESREKWKDVHLDHSRPASRNRSFDRVRYPDLNDQRGKDFQLALFVMSRLTVVLVTFRPDKTPASTSLAVAHRLQYA